MGWLIDTSIWIAVERGALGAADIHAVTRQQPVYLSPVNIAEMQFGIDQRNEFAHRSAHSVAYARHQYFHIVLPLVGPWQRGAVGWCCR